MSRLAFLISALLAAWPLAAPAQQQRQGYSRPPDFADVAYGPHARNVLDLWKAPSEKPAPLVIHIHGGGFRAGDKRQLRPELLDLCLKRGISVATINYRLSDHATYPDFMMDGARAVQYLRSRAKEWNLDPKRFAATGGSAGAGMSLWIGFHDDLANPSSSDPVLRQSTRLSAMGVSGAQSSYDPRVIRALIGEPAARHPAFDGFYKLRPEETDSAKAHRMYDDASPITHLSKGDPPVIMFYGEDNIPVPPDAKPGAGIHHPRFGYYLKERMDKLGIECVVRLRSEYAADSPVTFQSEMVAFFEKHFGR
jgi:acetyl esterase/lipase